MMNTSLPIYPSSLSISRVNVIFLPWKSVSISNLYIIVRVSPSLNLPKSFLSSITLTSLSTTSSSASTSSMLSSDMFTRVIEISIISPGSAIPFPLLRDPSDVRSSMTPLRSAKPAGGRYLIFPPHRMVKVSWPITPSSSTSMVNPTVRPSTSNVFPSIVTRKGSPV